jgi:hypothetical protein
MAENRWSDEYKDPAETPGRKGPSPDQWEEGSAAQFGEPKPGMSGGMKAFLIVLAVLGACCLLCCGIGGYFIYSVAHGITQSVAPAVVNAARDEIGTITLPAGFEPVHMFKMDNMFMLMTAVEYHNPAIHGQISLAEMKLKVGGSPQQSQAQMRQQLEQQGFGKRKLLDNSKSERKTIKIKGRECQFDFTEGVDPIDKKKFRQVSGVFDGKNGPAFIMIEMDDSAYKENAIVNMLETIH